MKMLGWRNNNQIKLLNKLVIKMNSLNENRDTESK